MPLYIALSSTSAKTASFSSSDILFAKNISPIDAQVSAYASEFGRSYGFVKASPCRVEPSAPVMYIFEEYISSKSVRQAFM